MAQGKENWPDVGELVVTTVKRIVPYGAYVTLDEYADKEGLLHISEISSTWVKNIRNHVREGQKAVLKVLRIDAERGHIDLSLRRVTGRERKERMLEWKRSRKAEVFLKMAAEKIGVSLEEAYNKAGYQMENYFGSLYNAFEEASERGEEALIKAKVPEEWAKVLTEIAKTKIKIAKVKVKGNLELTCTKPNGIDIIRDALTQAKNIKKPKSADINIYVVGAPRYTIEVLARNYKVAERLLEGAVETAIKGVETFGGQGTFTRET